MTLKLQPVTQRQAFKFITEHHRHHKPPAGFKFAIGVNDGEKLVGVVIVGRPVARGLDDGMTAEISRCCTDNTKNAASMLYGAATRAARAMGYDRVITYIRCDENGVSLRAAGWIPVYDTRGKSWNVPSRPRVDKTEIVDRQLWSADEWGKNP